MFIGTYFSSRIQCLYLLNVIRNCPVDVTLQYIAIFIKISQQVNILNEIMVRADYLLTTE